MADRFYTSFPLSPGPVMLDGPEARHLAAVRRFRAGDEVVLFNGDGREYPAEVVAVERKAIALNVLRVEASNRELPFRLEVAAPLPKGDRGHFLVEKLTELGATDLVPLKTERSVVHPRETKLDRLQRAVIEASKQCGRNVLMQIHPLASWSEYCRRADLPSRKLLAHPPGKRKGRGTVNEDVAIAVGPEGGFADAELSMGMEAGWQVVSLGPRVLRIETAVIALAALLALDL